MKQIIVLFFFLLSLISLGQKSKEFNAKFDIALKQFESTNYEKARILFSELDKKHKNNVHFENSHYFTALSYYLEKQTVKAKQLLAQMTNKFQNWSRIEEVYYLLAVISFEEDKNFDAVSYLQHCKSNKVMLDAVNLKKSFLYKIQNLETLKYLHSRFPEDETLALVLAHKFTEKDYLTSDDKMLLSYLMQTFVLDNELQERLKDLENKGKKEVYNVSVLFPFEIDKLMEFQTKNHNQFVVDLYNGMRIGFNELNNGDTKFKVNLYDTKNDTSELKRLLYLKEMTFSDMIIGPIYPLENKFISPFCLRHGVTKVNPFSKTPIKSDSMISLYFEPSAYTEGVKAAIFCFDSIATEKVFITGYNDKKDSTFIKAFKSKFEALGGKKLKIRYFGKFDKILTDLQEMEIDTSNTKAIVVYNHKSKMVSNMCSYYTVQRSEIPLITTNKFVEAKQFLPEAYKYTDFYVLHSEYLNDNAVQVFNKKYYEEYKMPASHYAYKGYEMVTFFGDQLMKNGKYFISQLKEVETSYAGKLYSKFNYYNSSSNTYLPVMKMVDYQLKLINEPLDEPNKK